MQKYPSSTKALKVLVLVNFVIANVFVTYGILTAQDDIVAFGIAMACLAGLIVVHHIEKDS